MERRRERRRENERKREGWRERKRTVGEWVRGDKKERESRPVLILEDRDGVVVGERGEDEAARGVLRAAVEETRLVAEDDALERDDPHEVLLRRLRVQRAHVLHRVGLRAEPVPRGDILWVERKSGKGIG
jgi:hypothetical protein